MPEIQKLIGAAAIELLRSTIEDARGNEVFFLAGTDEEGIIKEVLPLARGNDSAVPALMQVAKPGDVILHNHPSGHLTPSNADVGLASEYGNLGVGFYIIDNRVSQVYIVVAAFPHEKTHALDSAAISNHLQKTQGLRISPRAATHDCGSFVRLQRFPPGSD
jgi:ATP-dependent DNA helicase DinG